MTVFTRCQQVRATVSHLIQLTWLMLLRRLLIKILRDLSANSEDSYDSDAAFRFDLRYPVKLSLNSAGLSLANLASIFNINALLYLFLLVK